MGRTLKANRGGGWIPVSMAGVFLLLFFSGIFFYVRWSKDVWEKDERLRIKEVLLSLRTSIENELFAHIYYTRSVAAYVSLHPDLDDNEYHNLAAELVRDDPIIQSMSLSPGGVLSVIYPNEGLEEVLGLDLFAHPERRKIVEKTIETGRTFVAGPVELVEGGSAFISYTPVFDKTKEGDPEFWGVSDIVIRRDDLFDVAGVEALSHGASISLRGFDGKGAEGEVFFGAPEVFDEDPVEVTVQLPDGEWILAGCPTGGWTDYIEHHSITLSMMAGSSVVISVLVGFLASFILRLRASARQLNALNEDKTRLLSIIAHDLRSPISAISGLTGTMMDTDESGMSPDVRESVRMIDGCAEEGLLLLENLLDWVRSREDGEMTEFTEIDVGAVCEETTGAFAAAAEAKSVQVVNRVLGKSVRFDKRVLSTVLRNLVSNAVKFSPNGEVVEIISRVYGIEKLEILVQDHGCGMSAEKVNRLILGENRGSYRGMESDQGAGIGLMLCQDLLHACGELLFIESEEGKGTVVSFTVPA